MIVHMLLEGRHEEPVARKLIRHCGHSPGTVYGGKGCAYIRAHAGKYLYLASPDNAVLVLTDFMDSGCPCPPEAYRRYISGRYASVPPTFLCRFAVKELESWLMADSEGLAAYFRIAAARIPARPETVDDPKRTLVNLARLSRLSRLRYGMVPPSRHGGVVGPGYTEIVSEFITEKWSPERAAKNAPSLARCIKRLRELAG